MTPEERRAWIRMLGILLLAAAVRAGWAARGADRLEVGRERDAVAALDTVNQLAEEAERRSRPLRAGERIDPNRADEIELDRLPGVGPATASAIVGARSEAPFTEVRDLLRVRGIGPATLARIEPYLRMTGPGVIQRGGRPRADRERSDADRIDVNRADSVMLLRLPGIGPALAGRIVRERRENGAFATVEELVRVSGIGPATIERLRAHVAAR